jgi:hypothetical protein
VWSVRPVNGVSVRKYILIIAQVVVPCLGQTNFVEIEGAYVVIKFKLLGPEISNILIVDTETITAVLM